MLGWGSFSNVRTCSVACIPTFLLDRLQNLSSNKRPISSFFHSSSIIQPPTLERQQLKSKDANFARHHQRHPRPASKHHAHQRLRREATLSNSPEDQAKWQRLLARVKQHYVSWPNDRVKPKADHIAFVTAIGHVLKLPKDCTKFRSLQVSFQDWEDDDSGQSFAGTVEKYADYELGHERVRGFTTFRWMHSSMYKGVGKKSIYSADEVATSLEGVESAEDVEWSMYGDEPDASMWNTLYIGALNAWSSVVGISDEEKANMQYKEFFGRRMEGKTKAWTAIKTLRLCHGFGNGATAAVCKLPTELLDQIEDALIVLEGAPASLGDMLKRHEEKDGQRRAEFNARFGTMAV